MVHDQHGRCSGRRSASIWRDFRRTILCTFIDMDRQVLLRLWVPIDLLFYPDQHMRGSHNCSHVFSALRRRL